MKITKTNSGKQEVRMSKQEWINVGKKAGWMKEAGITEEQWAAMDPNEKRTKARRTFSRGISARIGVGLEDLPDTSEIQIENWWDESMDLATTISVLREAINEVCSSVEEDGIGSSFF